MKDRQKYLYLIIGIVLALIWGFRPVWKVVRHFVQQTAERNTEEEQHIQKNDESRSLEEKLNSAFIMTEGSSLCFYKNQQIENEQIPFIENGILYLPVEILAKQKKGSVIRADEVWYVRFQESICAMMEVYNIFLKNQEPVNMKGCPAERDGHLYLSAADLGTLFSMTVQVEEESGTAVIGAFESLSQEEWEQLREKTDSILKRNTEKAYIKKWRGATGLPEEEIRILAKESCLYYLDEEGRLWNYLYTDEGIVQKKEEEMVPDGCGKAGYYASGKIQEVLNKWDFQVKRELNREKFYRVENGTYQECGCNPKTWKEQKTMKDLEIFMENLAVQDMGENPETADLSFSHLVETAQPGDFLVYKASGADAKYGFFNHSALILETDTKENRIHVLHARSTELGVGFEEDMDTFGESELLKSDYWGNYQMIYLCTPRVDISDKRERIVKAACEKYKDYTFGYGSWLGKKETNCAEIIAESYKNVGIYLVPDLSVSSRLKEVLSGNAGNMVIVPDDLLLGKNGMVKAVWKKTEELN
ncbi:MAG: hypothetical protein ACI4EO_09890 [Blautia sp.]